MKLKQNTTFLEILRWSFLGLAILLFIWLAKKLLQGQ